MMQDAPKKMCHCFSLIHVRFDLVNQGKCLHGIKVLCGENQPRGKGQGRIQGGAGDIRPPPKFGIFCPYFRIASQ